MRTKAPVVVAAMLALLPRWAAGQRDSGLGTRAWGINPESLAPSPDLIPLGQLVTTISLERQDPAATP